MNANCVREDYIRTASRRAGMDRRRIFFVPCYLRHALPAPRRDPCHCLLAGSEIAGASPDTGNLLIALPWLADLNNLRLLQWLTASPKQ